MNKKEFFDKFIKKIYSALNTNERNIRFLLGSNCRAYEKNTNFYCSYNLRQKVINCSEQSICMNNVSSIMAIVMQGPIISEDDFTYCSLKYYREMYSDMTIILSTWDDSDPVQLEKIKKLNVIVLTNKKPQVYGMGNINFQVISSLEGIKCAERLGKKYVLKTRSDQRLYKPLFMNYLMALLNKFPIDEEDYIERVHSRMIVLQSNVFYGMLIPYFVSDFLYFGHIEDIKALFSIPLDESPNRTKDERRAYLNELISEGGTIKEYYYKSAPEIMLMKNYALQHISSEFDDNVKDYWKLLEKYLISLSWEDVDLFWPKYDRYNEMTLHKRLDAGENKYLDQYNCSFQNWLMLYDKMIIYDNSVENFCMQNIDVLNLII